ncbi:MAG: hypothetical protein ACJAT2_002243 [Bacteriovoracaceae bacterium]|jgi:hypothetical protein
MQDIEIRRLDYSEDTVIEKLKELRPFAIIFDFSKELKNINSLFMKLNFVKKCPDYKSLPIISLFSSKSDLEKHAYLFAMGLNYPFIKGSDEKILFSDIHYISFESETPFGKYAKAQLNNLPYDGKLISNIYGFTENSILIESDLYSETESLEKISLEFTGEEKTLEVRTQGSYDLGITGTYLFRGEYEVPFLGPWDEPTSDLILKDSYESWLEENEDLFKQKLGRALIVSSRVDDYILAGELTDLTQFDIYNSSSFEETKRFLESYKFDLIFFRLDKNDDPKKTENNFENLFRLTNAVKNISDGESIFVVFNSPSRTDAIRKALEYNQVLSVSDDIYKDKLSSLISVFEQKGRKMSCQTYCYAPYLNDARCYFNIEMMVSSITEHEITFYSESDIPMYSLLKIEVPSSLFLIIVPPTTQLEMDKKGNHYMAFITGGEESDAELLRSFVNRAIIDGLEEFSLIPTSPEVEAGEGLLDDMENEVIEDLETSAPINEANERKLVVRKTNTNGKTKL